MTPKTLSIAIMGTRGVPARYGGFETFAEELSTRLVRRGHDVSVYCRRSLYPDATETFRGVRRIDLPAIPHKYFETVSHAFLSSLDAFRRDFDVVLLCNAANAFVVPLLKLNRLPVAVNVDGIERKRKKWNALGRFVYMVGESVSVRYAQALVADAEVIARYYAKAHGARSEVIAYGAEFPDERDTDVLRRLGVESGKYLLYVSRMEPENNPLPVIQAYRKAEVTVPLVMLGSAPYSPLLLSELRSEARDGVIWPGALYGADYRTLQRNALLYIQATEVGGTHPALIEAMASGGVVIAYDTPENREVGGDAIGYFTFDGREPLEKKIRELLDGSVPRDVYRTRARNRVAERYTWDAVTDAYEKLFWELTS